MRDLIYAVAFLLAFVTLLMALFAPDSDVADAIMVVLGVLAVVLIIVVEANS